MTIVFLAEKNTRCLFLKNVPFNATQEEILKVFPEAVNVSFPGRTKIPCKGWVSRREFRTKQASSKCHLSRDKINKQTRFDWVNQTSAFSLAFVEFKDKAVVTSLLKKKEEVKMGDRVVIVDSVGKSKIIKKTEATIVNKENKKTKGKPAGTWDVTSIIIMMFRFNMQCFFTGSSVWHDLPVFVQLQRSQTTGCMWAICPLQRQ